MSFEGINENICTSWIQKKEQHEQQNELSCLMDIPIDPSIIETSQPSGSIGSTSNHLHHELAMITTNVHQQFSIITKTQSSEIKKTSKRNITGPPKPFTLFVGGFNLKMIPQSTKSFIENDIGLRVCDISYRSNKCNQSFRIDINPSDKSKAFDPSIWVLGLIVKPFRHPKSQSYSLNRNHDYHIQYRNQSLTIIMIYPSSKLSP